MQRRGQRRTAVPKLWRPDEPKCWVRRHAHRIVEVFVAREPAVDRLSQEIRQAELGVQALSGVAQVLGDECRPPQAFIQLAHQKETGVGAAPRQTASLRAVAYRRWCTTLRLRRGSCRLSGHGDRCGCTIST